MINLTNQGQKIQVQTVRGLMEALSQLVEKGYGEHSIYRADVEAGPCGISAIELYDTSNERQRGELPYDYTFLIV